jgi:AraC family transcriptional regulator, regulatory protein of adaptative response / DNA-3-methyladenine glycosylase II
VILRPAEQPYDGAALLAFLALRAVPGVEEVLDDGTYRRSLPNGEILELRAVDGGMDATHDVSALLDMDAPVSEIAERLGDLYRPGTRVPGCVDGDEIAVRAVLGQQITVVAARTHAGRLVQAAGVPLERPRGAVTHIFPTLEAIAAAPDSAFAMPRSRRHTLRSLAGQPLDRLHELRGIGPWTQTYVNMRALKDRDAWLPTDIGVRHGLARHGPSDPERWRPFRAYAVISLWTRT